MNTNDDLNKDKLLVRVRKMMALANDAGASEGERDNALRMVQTILAKYNLSLADAEAAGEKQDDKRVESQEIFSAQSYHRTVMSAVADLYFCKYFYCQLSSGKQRHYFFGRESNNTTAREMSAFINKSINREAGKRMRAQAESSNWHRSFCKGAAAKIWQRCDQLRREAEQAPAVASTGTALVLASVYKNEKEANALMIAAEGHKLRQTASREHNTSSDGFYSGKEFGGSINLNRQLGGGTNGKKQLN